MGLVQRKVGIIGGTGRMGSWFADLLERSGETVYRIGRSTELTPSEAAKNCDVVVISVPIAETVNIIREIGPLVPKHALLMDLTSIKKEPVKAMLEHSDSQVVGLHPLFGPDNLITKGRKAVVCHGRGKQGIDWLTHTLEQFGIELIYMDPLSHDRLMGIIQGVNHLSTLALGLSLSRSEFLCNEIVRSSTQTFAQRIDRIRAVLEQPPELFESILMDNSEAEEFIGTYKDAVRELSEITTNRDREKFRDIFKSLKAFCASKQEKR